MFESLSRESISHSQISSHDLNIRNDLFITSGLDFIIAVISKNERIIDGEPRFSGSRSSWSLRS